MESNMPNINDQGLREVIRTAQSYMNPTMLSPEDEQTLCAMVKALRAGQNSIIMVENSKGALQYMLVGCNKIEGVQMLSKVIDKLIHEHQD